LGHTPAHVEFIEPNSGIRPTSIKVGATAATGFTGQVIATALCAR
jgi:CRISPR/Cas system endoribonuclease Cas6 (RAMP superfamily)